MRKIWWDYLLVFLIFSNLRDLAILDLLTFFEGKVLQYMTVSKPLTSMPSSLSLGNCASWLDALLGVMRSSGLLPVECRPRVCPNRRSTLLQVLFLLTTAALTRTSSKHTRDPTQAWNLHCGRGRVFFTADLGSRGTCAPLRLGHFIEYLLDMVTASTPCLFCYCSEFSLVSYKLSYIMYREP